MMENFIVRFKIQKSFDIESHNQDSKHSIKLLRSKVIDAFKCSGSGLSYIDAQSLDSVKMTD